jgi:hypothetical protein
MNLKKTIATVLASLAVGALVALSAPVSAPAQAATAPKASAAQLPAVEVTHFTDTTYLIGLDWTPVEISDDALYHLKISVDGSSYKTVDSWAGADQQIRFTVGTVTDYFPAAKSGLKGRALMSYELNGKSSADSNSFSFTADPDDFNSIHWTD